MELPTAIRRRLRSAKRDVLIAAAKSGLGEPGHTAKRLQHAYGLPPEAFLEARVAMIDRLPAGLDLSGTFVDLGAHVGNWTGAVRACFPNAEIVAVEPYPPSYETVRRRFASDSRIRVENCALDRQSGEAVFHTGRAEVFGSLLEFDPGMESFYGQPATSTGQIMVATRTLDDVVRGPVSVLKIDVQGAELRVFEGGHRTLAQTQAVIAEGLFAEHYRNGSSFVDVYSALTQLGFVFWDLGEPYRDEHGRALWADMVFVRDPATARS